jgi:excisionase family DNA binding protein
MATLSAPLLLTVEEAARRLDIGRNLAYRLVAEGKLRSIKVGRLRKVPVIALAQYIDEELTAQS